MKIIKIGVCAHVDPGKTTLTSAIENVLADQRKSLNEIIVDSQLIKITRDKINEIPSLPRGENRRERRERERKNKKRKP